MRQVWGSVHGRGNVGGECGRPIVTSGEVGGRSVACS